MVTLATLMDIGARAEFACQIELSKRNERAIVEVAEANAALVAAARHGATISDRAHAARQVEEGAAALNATLPILLAGMGPDRTAGGAPRGGDT